MTQIGTELTGFEFNAHHNHTETYTKTKFYKFLNDNLKHYKFEYKLGLNTDIIPFNPSGKCSEGGLYFCEESKCHLYWRSYGKKLGIIEIPDDARVYVEENKFKADKIIITEIINFEDVEDRFGVNILPHIGYVLQFVKNQTDEICSRAVQQNGLALGYVNIQTEEICMLAVKQNGFALEYVKDDMQTEEICILAVEQNGTAFEYVKEQTEEICKLAVQKNGHVLQIVKNQTDEICILAVKQNGNALEYVKNQTKEICILAVEQNGLALEYVKNQTEEICVRAVKQNCLAYYYVNKSFLTEAICKLAGR